MRLNYKYYICVFTSKNIAVYTLSFLEKSGYKNFQLVSTPCEIKAGCSYSIKFNNLKYLDILKEETEKIGVKVEKIYLIERKDGKRTIQKLTI
ncbi:DUF3343 domain-containing protein [Schnuerera sp. xch1]|uniref:DUF3343 domain-containing protein n=1 Tax=Schnuerera sp. xch1 TaxID=2874283 RepID=UPI001CBDD1E5|nr:DUF3343 domain-containing protein [Schnuerera sp. xch1]MBZ2173701.1 DUF3343 domain-containing protein [Schnuerera sp. xch1]